MTKDLFSTNSAAYSQFRPSYPDHIFDIILSFVRDKNNAWDCGTGNGQVAFQLSKYFKQVFASDISKGQISKAPLKENISYSVQPAESTSFPDNIFDLIVVAQAIHWFDIEGFYAEVNRTSRNNAIIAALGYGLIGTDNTELNELIRRFYVDITGPYWDKERKYVDEEYQSIPFPFEEITVPHTRNEVEWDFESFIGYLGTWSAVSHYKNKNASDPLDLVTEDIRSFFNKDEKINFSFPVFMRLGRITKSLNSQIPDPKP